MKNFFKRSKEEVNETMDNTEQTVLDTNDNESFANTWKEKLAKANWKKIGIIAGSVCGALFVIYFGFSIYFQNHFYFRSTVNGVSASAKSAAAVEKNIMKAADDYSIAIIDDDAGKTQETITQSEIDLSVEFNGEVQQLLTKQNGFAWVKYLFVPKEYVSDSIVSFDEAKLESIVSGLECVTREDKTPTENATFVYKDGEYSIKDEVYGTDIDATQFAQKVGAAITSLQKELSLEEDKCYIQPTVTADSKELKNLVKTLNKYIDVKITYTVGDNTEVVDQEEISKWLSADENLNPAFNQEAMSEYVSTMGKKYNTYGQSKSLATSYGTTVTVPGGNYGWKIDNEGEVAQLISDIQSEKDVNRDFVYSVKANSRGANDYGDSYVEINLTAQHLYLYKNGSLVVESDFVSGNVSKGNGSPTGAYKITYTEANATLNGENYSTPVSFWMPFAGNVGMHDATWRSSFGGSIYKTAGSHGCINLPYSAAQTIFNNIGTGYAVLVYNLPGTESTKGIAQDAANGVIDTINSIGEVTLDSEGTIAAARAQYNALSDEARGYVTNADVLAAAEARLAQLKDEANQSSANQDAANKVIDLINAIGTVDATDGSKAKIKAANDAYNALNDDAKSKVTNKSILDAAKTQYNTLSGTSTF